MDEEYGDEEENVKKPSVENPIVAKIFSVDQFKQVCKECNELMKNAEEKKAELKEIKDKIETYVNQQLEDYISKKKEKKSKPKEPLFDLV